MICHKYKCIFVHIPKTAGQSIEHVFLNLLGLNWDTREPLLLKFNYDKKLGPPRLAHLKAHEYLKYNYISQSMFDVYYKFSFVRNPWSRIVSFYNYRRYYQLFSFKNFVTKMLKNKIRDKDYWFIGPQYEFIMDHNGEMLVDYVGRFENLQNDFNNICKALGLNEINLPHVNRARKEISILSFLKQNKREKKHYSEYYDSETKEIVENAYKNDIQIFNYSF
jgi:hypothetical protein